MDADRTVTVRIELVDAEPKVWREILLPADLPLPLLHDAIQSVMGWEDAHLHGFARGSGFWSAAPTWVPFVEEPGRELDEASASLADILPSRRSVATYLYDFGDDWEHRLSIVDERPGRIDRAELLRGEGGVTPEDCGGVGGRAMLLAILQGKLGGHNVPEDAEEFFTYLLGSDLEKAQDDLLVFNAEAAQKMLDQVPMSSGASPAASRRSPTASEPVLDPAVLRVRPDLLSLVTESVYTGHSALAQMILDARLDDAPALDHEACVSLSEPVRQFLDVIGEGVPLTSAGYLRPKDVAVLSERLRIGEEWIGTLNRENQTVPVLYFREALTVMRLVRIRSNRLVPVKSTLAKADTPEGLVELLASRLPVGTGSSNRRTFEAVAGMLVMLDLAGRPIAEDDEATTSDLGAHAAAYARLGAAHAAGPFGEWASSPQQDGIDVVQQAARTLAVLRRCGVLARCRGDFQWAPTKAGRAFLAYALTMG